MACTGSTQCINAYVRVTFIIKSKREKLGLNLYAHLMEWKNFRKLICMPCKNGQDEKYIYTHCQKKRKIGASYVCWTHQSEFFWIVLLDMRMVRSIV